MMNCNGDRRKQDSRSLGENLNPEPPEYEAGVLTTRRQRSVECLLIRRY
jgi:hypothetical protein